MPKNNLYVFENDLYSKGYKKIAGLDEAGRGSWAGPLVVAICILPVGYKNDEIDDSKKLSAIKREKLYSVITNDALYWNVSIVEPSVIDKLNIKAATIQAMNKLIPESGCDFALIDAEKVDFQKSNSIIKGDALSITIAAASILAKVTRDRIMIELDKTYPLYCFKSNKGYGTSTHIHALEKNGIIEKVHRVSYAPIKNIINKTKTK